MKIANLIILTLSISCFVNMLSAQYDFDIVLEIEDSEIKSQGNTGTCWSFASVSFLESEAYSNKKGMIDLSEMYVVRNVYKEKARNYILRQGKANFSEGALAHDMLNAAKKYGIVPENVYSGKKGKKHDHSKMFDELKTYLDTIVVNKTIPSDWESDFDDIINGYLGEPIHDFLSDEKSINSKEYLKTLGLNIGDYTHVTSFTHHPFYTNFVLEIPDNFSNGSYYNVPIDELITLTEDALAAGHSVIWDGDVSEKGFSAQRGLAIHPKEIDEKCFDSPCPEIIESQADRQAAFESYVTTDDHLMHLVGIAKDQNGTKYYIIKNSWGEIGNYKGYLMMSEAYFRAKTVAITLDRNFVNNPEND